jgi:hypothetical protein
MTADGKAPDETLTGFDYLNQFPPNTQAAVKAILDGRDVPAGGRSSAAVQAIKNMRAWAMTLGNRWMLRPIMRGRRC